MQERGQYSEFVQWWQNIPGDFRELVTPVQDETHYEKLIFVFEQLMSELAATENKTGRQKKDPLVKDLYLLIGDHLWAYEKKTFPVPKSKPREALKFLMDQHCLTQKELPEVGSQGVVSEVLSGKRPLNLRQVGGLAKRFNVSTDLFIE